MIEFWNCNCPSWLPLILFEIVMELCSEGREQAIPLHCQYSDLGLIPGRWSDKKYLMWCCCQNITRTKWKIKHPQRTSVEWTTYFHYSLDLNKILCKNFWCVPKICFIVVHMNWCKVFLVMLLNNVIINATKTYYWSILLLHLLKVLKLNKN